MELALVRPRVKISPSRFRRCRGLSLRHFGPYGRKSRCVQLFIRHGDRDYDRSIAGLGAGKAQRYFAYDFDRLSSRLFDADRIAVMSRMWRLAPHALSQYSNIALDREKIDETNYMKVARIIWLALGFM
jgi:hypothetical protein